MARMKGVSDERAGGVVRFLFRGIRQKAGRVSDTFRIAAFNPRILIGWSAFEYALDGAEDLPPNLRKLAELKVSMLVGCPA